MTIDTPYPVPITSLDVFRGHWYYCHTPFSPSLYFCTADVATPQMHFNHNRARCDFYETSFSGIKNHLSGVEHGTAAAGKFIRFLEQGASVKNWQSMGASVQISRRNAKFCQEVRACW